MTFRKKLAKAVILLTLLVISLFPALLAGEYRIKPEQALSLIRSKITGAPAPDISRAQEVIIWRIRLPRLLLAITAGMALSVSGAAYQGCFRNPLVEPYILGVSSGAACGAALSVIFPHVLPQGQLAAFAFAVAAVFISYSLARNKGQIPPVALVLSGIIVGALFSALVGILKYIAADTQLREITFWMMGGLYYATWKDAVLNLTVVGPVFLMLWYCGWQLNLLSLGDEEARSLGLSPAVFRFVILIAATLTAAVCVSICGIIAWVGLMMPHAARMIFGPDHRWVMPGAAMLGAIYLLVCDTLARTLTPAEIPLGIITSIVGAPYLLWLLRSKGRSMYGV
ncbi:iron ABC transporter permease [Desulfosarcina sp. OttesenSCG-928-G10]|nr:iron ABC transporter permease [Desulfosarcina sp. OttesenSCG-928-G10]MDL2321047.1 iron ABC transporter permease [Desulfosarcina sp. OttesenSCG-928-B08]